MKLALQKIRDRLDEQLHYLPMKDEFTRAVYIMTDRVVPTITDYPAVGLKDGAAEYELVGGTLADGGMFDKQMTVRVTAFVQLLREEDIITGNDDQKGILDVIEDIKTALLGWLPDATYNAPLVALREGESEVLSDDTVLIQTKDIIFQFAQQEEV